MKTINTIIKTIKKSTKVAIFGHQSPDGDCLGSIFATSFLCEKLGKKVDAFIDDDLNDTYSFLNMYNLNQCEFDTNNYDLVITVDVASGRQLGKYNEFFNLMQNKICIDHHHSRDLIGNINYIIENSSCCENIYGIIKKAKLKITKEVATMLYLGVSDDTGCFLHDNTTENTHKLAGELFKLGADFKLINYKIFKLQTLKSFKMTKLLNEHVVMDNGVTYIVVSNEFLVKNDFESHDMGDYVNTLLNLEGTKISFVMTEKQHEVYSISFRSIRGYDVSKVAKCFDGGGHIQAAGARITGKISKCLEAVLDKCKQAVEKGDKDV